MELVSIPATPVEFAAILTSLSIEMVLFYSLPFKVAWPRGNCRSDITYAE